MDLKLSRRGRRYGALFSPPKPTDLGFPLQLIKQIRLADMPPRAFLTGAFGPVKDQGSEGSCTAHGSTSMGERLYRRWLSQSPIFSPAFTYYKEREMEGTLGDGDCGAQVETSLMVADPRAGGFGWCPLEDMPYVPGDINTAPTAAQIAAAAKFPGGAYHSIGGNIINCKLCILSDYSAVIGISVYESFESDEAEQSGLIPFPNVNAEDLEGGHEMHSLLGYDDTIQCPNAPNPGAILTENSWGTDWGIEVPALAGITTRGLCWMPYDYIGNVNLTSDVRLGHLGLPW